MIENQLDDTQDWSEPGSTWGDRLLIKSRKTAKYYRTRGERWQQYWESRESSKTGTVWVPRTGYFNLVSNRQPIGAVLPFTGSSINREMTKKNRPAEPVSDPEDARGAVIDREFSARSKSIVRSKATAFYRVAGAEKTFCTLSFINDVTDRQAVEILNKFLTVVRYERESFEYLWVVERQLGKEGNEGTMRPHFHLIFNQRLPIQRFNALWVLQQYNAGIEHPDLPMKEMQERYDFTIANPDVKKKTHTLYSHTLQARLNPVDIVKVNGMSKLAFYMTKYITKGKNQGTFQCAMWHCSRGVSSLFTRAMATEDNRAAAVSFDNCLVEKTTGLIIKEAEVWTDPNSACINFSIVTYYQQGKFLKYLREMEAINYWLLKKRITRDDVIKYIDPGRRN